MKEITKGNAKQEELTRTGGGFCSSHPHTIPPSYSKVFRAFQNANMVGHTQVVGDISLFLVGGTSSKVSGCLAFLFLLSTSPCSVNTSLFPVLFFSLYSWLVCGCWLSSNCGLLKATSNTGMEISKGKRPPCKSPTLLA